MSKGGAGTARRNEREAPQYVRSLPDPRLSVLPSGWQGHGARVCIIDTGCEPFSPIRRGIRNEDVRDFVNPLGHALDESPDRHGTTVASIIRQYAPAVTLGVAKVGVGPNVDLEATLQALRWARDEWGAHVVNLSLGFHGCRMGTCSVCTQANSLVRQGLVVVAAAGNYNSNVPRSSELTCPARASRVVAVGAVDESGAFAAYNISETNGLAKPNILAPGTIKLAAGETFTGTSFAAPVVTAAIAALGQRMGYTNAVDLLVSTASETVKVPGAGGWSRYGVMDFARAWEVASSG